MKLLNVDKQDNMLNDIFWKPEHIVPVAILPANSYIHGIKPLRLMSRILSPAPIQLDKAVAIVRIILGLMIMYHGVEIFSPETMRGYLKWDVFQFNAATVMVYAGKTSELTAGILLTLGLFTRIGAVLLTGTMSYITFFVGNGRFWYEDQHPFMFALFGLLFIFLGPGSWSLDGLLWGGKPAVGNGK